MNSQDRTASKTPLSGEPPLSSVSWVGKTMQLEKGKSLRVLGRIGVGGSGEVFLAQEICSETKDVFKDVALKIGRKDALEHEWEVHKRLDKKDNVVSPPINHLENIEFPCLQYEFAQHGDLRQYLNTFQGGVRQLTAMQATSIFLQVVTGVANAHSLKGRRQVIHRDLKPGNILVFAGSDGKPQFRVADFGMAHANRNPEIPYSKVTSETETVIQGGTIDYMSPQQRAGKHPDKRDDVYSLGKIWYQLLANNFDEGIGTNLERQLEKICPELPQEIKVLVKLCVDEERTKDMPKDAVELKARLGELQKKMHPSRDNLLNDLLIQRKWQVPILQHIAKKEKRSEYSPFWGYVLDKDPDESVVTNHYFRERIIATGLPWRVRDIRTNIEMLLIPPGRFMMGASPDDLKAVSDEKPAHEVLISNAFYLGRTPVTQAQWQAKMGSKQSYINAQPNNPVVGVSWNMIQDFNTATGLRLPTEAEWEYACRAGSAAPRYGILNDIAWCNYNSDRATQAVATKLPNALGLCDTLGNVWEWCQDLFGNYSTASMVNPTGPMSGEERDDRLLRGGVLGDYIYSYDCRASQRHSDSPDTIDSSIGFRVARTP